MLNKYTYKRQHYFHPEDSYDIVKNIYKVSHCETSLINYFLKVKSLQENLTLISRIEYKYCLISTSYLAGLFDIYILLYVSQNCECFGDFLPMRTLCDACHEDFQSH